MVGVRSVPNGVVAMTVTSRVRPAIGLVAALGVGLFAVLAFRADAASQKSDSTFVAIRPCRLFDTRSQVDFHVGPLSTFGSDEAQTAQAHGSNGECVVPLDAVGLSLNVTAVDASLPTFLTVWPGGALPRASSLNPLPGGVAFNAVTVPLASGSFQVYNLQGTVDVIVDVNGYYTTVVVDDLLTRLDRLETTQPIVASQDKRDPQVIDETARGMAYQFIPNPMGGHQVVNYSVNVEQDEAGVVVECWIDEGAAGSRSSPRIWESPGSPGGSGHISGSAATSVSDGEEGAFASLVCRHSGAENPTIATSAHLNIVFYPDVASTVS